MGRSLAGGDCARARAADACSRSTRPPAGRDSSSASGIIWVPMSCCCFRRIIRTGSSMATTRCRLACRPAGAARCMVDNPLATYPRLHGGHAMNAYCSAAATPSRPARQEPTGDRRLRSASDAEFACRPAAVPGPALVAASANVRRAAAAWLPDRLRLSEGLAWCQSPRRGSAEGGKPGGNFGVHAVRSISIPTMCSLAFST